MGPHRPHPNPVKGAFFGGTLFTSKWLNLAILFAWRFELRAAGIACQRTAEGFDDRPLGDALAAAEVQRALKEAVHTISRHSGASAASFTLVIHGGSLAVRIEDNGVGIPACHPPATIQSRGTLYSFFTNTVSWIGLRIGRMLAPMFFLSGARAVGNSGSVISPPLPRASTFGSRPLPSRPVAAFLGVPEKLAAMRAVIDPSLHRARHEKKA
jgi:hypothetical protein